MKQSRLNTITGGSQFAPETDGQFSPEGTGQFEPEIGGQLHRIFHHPTSITISYFIN
jgi:hypothetical protein